MVVRARRWPGLLLLAPMVVAGVVAGALAIADRVRPDRPGDLTLAAAADTVRQAVRTSTRSPAEHDTVVVVAPPWSMRPLQALGSLAARTIPADGAWDVLVDGRFRRVVVVAEADAAPWLDRPLMARARPLSHHAIDGGPIDVLVIDGAAARFDARSALDTASIRVVDAADDAAPCERRGRGVGAGFRCVGAPAVRVQREWALVSENGADVVFASPPPAGRRLEITYADVELGDVLVVAAGHTRFGSERADPVRGAVTVDVVVDDDVVATLVRRPSFFVEPHRRGLRERFVNATANGNRVADIAVTDRGFHAERLDTARFAAGTHRLAFVIRTDDDSNNHFAFDAFVPGAVGATSGAAR